MLFHLFFSIIFYFYYFFLQAHLKRVFNFNKMTGCQKYNIQTQVSCYLKVSYLSLFEQVVIFLGYICLFYNRLHFQGKTVSFRKVKISCPVILILWHWLCFSFQFQLSWNINYKLRFLTFSLFLPYHIFEVPFQHKRIVLTYHRAKYHRFQWIQTSKSDFKGIT